MAQRKTFKKAIKKVHILTKLTIVMCLVLGILIGFVLCSWISRGDCFRLKGTTSFSIDVGVDGGRYLYTEEGAEAICFGQDVSGTLQVETTLKKDSQGRYVIPTNKEGVYTITYTVDCLKFGEHAPGGAIKRVRVFTVTASEEETGNG